jgi:hypothetical protein
MRNYSGWPLRCDLYFFRCLENHLSTFLGVWVHSTNGFHGFLSIIDPPSFKSSLSTLVTTACLMFMILIERATFLVRPSQRSGLPVLHRNPQERVHTFPNIIKVAVPSPQHSPMFGQLPEVQMVSSCICLLSHEVLCISGLLEVLPSTILV